MNHSHLTYGPGKSESMSKKEQLLYSCERVPGSSEKQISLLLDADCCHICRRFKKAGLNEGGTFFRDREAFTTVQLSD